MPDTFGNYNCRQAGVLIVAHQKTDYPEEHTDFISINCEAQCSNATPFQGDLDYG